MKTALVTGASSDIGRAVAIALAKKHFNLALHYWTRKKPVLAIRDAVAPLSIACELYCRDLTDPEQARTLLNEAVDRFGGIDAIINVVGPFSYRPILETTPHDFTEALSLNLNTCFFVTHYALDILRKSKGHVVNFAFAGVENSKAWPMSTAYCAAKSGVAVLTKSLAATLAPEGVRVNAVCPGLVEEGQITADERREMAAQIPFGRPVKPNEVADTVVWLVTESPSVLTGAMIAVSGGWEY